MSVVDWKYRLLRGGVDLMRWSRDLALIAGIRSYGLLTRREGDDGRAEWGTLTADLSSDNSSCLVVNPCLVVTDGTDSLSVSYQAGEAVLGTTTAAPVRVATNAGALVIEDTASGGDVTLSCSGAVTVGGGGGVSMEYTGGATLDVEAGRATVALGSRSVQITPGAVCAVVADALAGALSVGVASSGTGALIIPPDHKLLAGSGGHVLVGHDGDTTGERVVTGRGVYKATDTDRTATTRTLDPELQVAVRASWRYQWHLMLIRSGPDGSADIKYGLAGPSGASAHWKFTHDGVTYRDLSNEATGNLTTTVQALSATGTLETDAAGDFGLSWSRNTAGANSARIHAGSYLVLTDLGPA